MGYVVLARKYRPRNFGEMAGQEHVVRALTNALTQGRLHHAYLFTGTRGIGKTTISRILAKSLNCVGPDGRSGVTAEPCGVCAACTEIDADRYIDYIELDAASHRSIDEIRDLIERAAYKPTVGRYKVFMIDEAHQLTKDAFNALLKTLEEPPEYLKFVLATTDPERMLPTVLSRCLQFNLRPMAPETIRQHLSRVLSSEGVPFDDPALRAVARAARGSMRDALSLTDQALAFGAGRLEAGTVRDMLGAVETGVPARIVGALAERNAADVLAAVQSLRESGLSCAGTLEQMVELLQSMAVEQAVPGASALEGDEGEAVRDLAARMPADETQFLYSLALHGREELSLAPDPFAALTMLLLRFVAMTAAELPAAEAPARAQPLRRPSAPAVAKAAVPVPVQEVQGADPDAMARWEPLVRSLVEAQQLSGLARELALQGQALSCQGEDPVVWQLAVEHADLVTAAARDKLVEALAQRMGLAVRVEVLARSVTDSVARRDAAERERRQQQAEQAIRDDPMVKALLGQFATARIVSGSIKPLSGTNEGETR